jgi:hypothetical protein
MYKRKQPPTNVIVSQPSTNDIVPPKKKRRGRPKKNKKDAADAKDYSSINIDWSSIVGEKVQVLITKELAAVEDCEKAQSKVFQEDMCTKIIKKEKLEKLGYTVQKMRSKITCMSDPERNPITGHAQGDIHGNLHERWKYIQVYFDPDYSNVINMVDADYDVSSLADTYDSGSEHGSDIYGGYGGGVSSTTTTTTNTAISKSIETPTHTRIETPISTSSKTGKTMYERFKEKDINAKEVIRSSKKSTIDTTAVNALLHAQLDKMHGGSSSSKGTKEEQLEKKMNKLQVLLAAKTISNEQYKNMMDKLLVNYVVFD